MKYLKIIVEIIYLACLGSFVWSYDSKKIAYVAEVKNIAKEKCFLTSKTSAGSESTSDKSKDEILTENNYEKVNFS